MAQLKDTTITGDLSVSGKINQKTIDIDSNCKIIEFCKRLDLSAVNNEVQITLPDGYVCNPTSLGNAAGIYYYTYDDRTGSWTTDATVALSTINSQDGSTFTNALPIAHAQIASFGLLPLLP